MKKILLKTASILLLVVFLTACGNNSTPTAIPGGDVSAPTDVAAIVPTAQTDPCGNLYFPVQNKASYTYSSSGSPAGAYTFRNIISNASANGFTLTTKFNALPITQNWECKPEGVLAAGLGLTDAVSSLALEQFTNLTASNITGISLPANLAPGMEWAYALDLQGTEIVKEGQPAGNMTGHISMTFKARNAESVTVPAGVFDAIAVDVTIVSEFKILNASGQSQKISAHNNYTVWYAPGVGWIKSNGSGNLNGQEYFETIVLEAYKVR
jgi:predicted small lipoprotein YifL